MRSIHAERFKKEEGQNDEEKREKGRAIAGCFAVGLTTSTEDIDPGRRNTLSSLIIFVRTRVPQLRARLAMSIVPSTLVAESH